MRLRRSFRKQHSYVWRVAAGKRRGARIAGIGILATSLAVLGGASQAEATAAPSRHFAKAPAGSVVTEVPLGMSNAMTTFVVQMSGDPVTVVEADAATPLTADQKRSHRDELRNRQNTAETQIRKLGGKVVGKYQSTYNGMKITIQARKAPELLSIPNVVGVHRLQQMQPDNVRGIPAIGAPAAWDGTAGFHGEGIKIGIIDTGIDYTHADFGGPGTVAAYDAAHAAETSPADPSLFGPGAPKVKGGTALVGDAYNADPASP